VTVKLKCPKKCFDICFDCIVYRSPVRMYLICPAIHTVESAWINVGTVAYLCVLYMHAYVSVCTLVLHM